MFYTPLAEIRCSFRGKEKLIYAKLEYFNPTGSIKDRIADYILTKAKACGEIKDGQPIVEVTSGNTGIAFAALGARTKHPVHIFMPESASEERKILMQMYGAELHLIRQNGGYLRAIDMAKAFALQEGAYMPKQFENPHNAKAHYFGTGTEILRQLPNAGTFVSGVGTGGTIMGIGTLLKEKNNANIVAIEPKGMELLSGGTCGKPHKIEGIGDEFVPALYQKKLIDHVETILDEDAVIMASRLAKELGLGVGISSGANFLGCVLQNSERPIVTVFADDNKKYLSTTLRHPPKNKEGMLSSDVELIDVKIM